MKMPSEFFLRLKDGLSEWRDLIKHCSELIISPILEYFIKGIVKHSMV